MTPKTLHKKEPGVEDWIIQHANIFVPILFLVLIILMVALAYAIVGVSATDSGTYYNHLQDVI